jgi:hypothetical protein
VRPASRPLRRRARIRTLVSHRFDAPMAPRKNTRCPLSGCVSAVSHNEASKPRNRIYGSLGTVLRAVDVEAGIGLVERGAEIGAAADPGPCANVPWPAPCRGRCAAEQRRRAHHFGRGQGGNGCRGRSSVAGGLSLGRCRQQQAGDGEQPEMSALGQRLPPRMFFCVLPPIRLALSRQDAPRPSPNVPILAGNLPDLCCGRQALNPMLGCIARASSSKRDVEPVGIPRREGGGLVQR